MQIDKCPNFIGKLECPKCGRMMPDLCADQQELMEKARKYDEWKASQKPSTDTEGGPVVMAGELLKADPVGEPEETPKPRPKVTVRRK